MSILTRLTGQHLDDAALAEIWTNAAAEGSVPGHPHLDTCPECRVRFASFMAWLDGVRADGVAEADRVFSNERLAAQEAQIMRRLEALAQPTRVIAFPKTPATVTRPSPVRRWIAVAAAAAFVAGLGLGNILDLRHMSFDPSQSATRLADNVQPQRGNPAIVPAVAITTDDAMLAEFEALATPSYETLRAFDTMTPRAADYLQSSR